MVKLFTEDKTFRPRKFFRKGTKRDALHTVLVKTLGSAGNLREAVKLPPGEDVNEWLAVNTLDFYNQLNLLFGSIREYCTEEACPTMTAGDRYEYYWSDGSEKPVSLPAPVYVDTLITWVQGQLDDEKLFPCDDGVPFPGNFQEIVRTIFKRLFRIYAHVYYSHYTTIKDVGEEKHLNTCYKHFLYFCEEFDLVNKKEMAPLQTLSAKLLGPSLDGNN